MARSVRRTLMIATSVEGLSRVSTEELDRSAQRLVASESWHVAFLIAHLAEISERRLHLSLGYKNLFEYCVRRLGLSEGQAGLRI